MSAMMFKITGVSIVYSTVCSGEITGNIKAPRHWPLCMCVCVCVCVCVGGGGGGGGVTGH